MRRANVGANVGTQARSFLSLFRNLLKEMAPHTVMNWNQITTWLYEIDLLRRTIIECVALPYKDMFARSAWHSLTYPGLEWNRVG
jgi:hypothetical protein